MSHPRTPATDAATRAEALQLAEKHGAAEASRRTGVPAGTIRAWRHRAGESAPPAGVDPASWAERKAQGAEDAWATAQAALAKVRGLLDAGKTGDAQRAALAFAILTDKAGVLEVAAHAADERRTRLSASQAALMAEVIEQYISSLGLSLTAASRRVLRELLRCASAGEPLVPGPDADVARREIREQIGSELSSSVPQLDAGDDGQRALPAPGATSAAGEAEPMVAPVTRVRALRERLKRPETPPEVVTGEVVDEPVRRPGWGGVEDAAREAADPEAAVGWDDDVWRPV